MGKYSEAFQYITGHVSRQLEQCFKKDQSVCLMLDDADNLGPALACHFLLTVTGKAGGKTHKKYSC